MRIWKIFGVVGVIGLMVLIGCKTPPPVGHPLSEGDGLPHTTSPRPSPGGEGGESPAAARHPLKRGTEDSIREYYERMELWEALHGGMSEMEGFK